MRQLVRPVVALTVLALTPAHAAHVPLHLDPASLAPIVSCGCAA